MTVDPKAAVTGPIVTGPDGVRYRLTGETRPYPMPFVGDVSFNPKSGLQSHIITNVHEDGYFLGRPAVVLDSRTEVYLIEPLPRIPNWPLPGPAPQYLLSSEDWKKANPDGGALPWEEGSLVAATSHAPWVEWEIFSPMRGGHNIDIWFLVARADPEVDA